MMLNSGHNVELQNCKKKTQHVSNEKIITIFFVLRFLCQYFYVLTILYKVTNNFHIQENSVFVCFYIFCIFIWRSCAYRKLPTVMCFIRKQSKSFHIERLNLRPEYSTIVASKHMHILITTSCNKFFLLF